VLDLNPFFSGLFLKERAVQIQRTLGVSIPFLSGLFLKASILFDALDYRSQSLFCQGSF